MSKEDQIRKLASVNSLKPIAGRTVIPGYSIDLTTMQTQTPERNKAEPLPSDDSYIDPKQLSEMANEDVARDLSSGGNSYTGSLEPDTRGFIGDYHKDDLKKQWDEIESNHSPEEIDQMLVDNENVLNGTYKSKYLKNGSKYSNGEEEESVRFLGESARYGRGIK